jgi:undecaprenyl-diphosphatase
MTAATSFKLLQFVLKEPTSVSTEQWLVLAVGFIVSFFVAWAVIAWFMSWVTRHGFAPFAIYRLIAGGLTLAWVYGYLAW